MKSQSPVEPIAMYFHLSESDTEPWYVKSGGKGVESGSSESKRKSAKAEHRKELMDPLLSMKQYVEAKKKSEDIPVKGTISRHNTHSQV